MNICGRFLSVSKSTYREGKVLVALVGDVYPHDLSKEQIAFIKTYYNMPHSAHEILIEWPDDVEPAFEAAKTNYHNGYLLLVNK